MKHICIIYNQTYGGTFAGGAAWTGLGRAPLCDVFVSWWYL